MPVFVAWLKQGRRAPPRERFCDARAVHGGGMGTEGGRRRRVCLVGRPPGVQALPAGAFLRPIHGTATWRSAVYQRSHTIATRRWGGGATNRFTRRGKSKFLRFGSQAAAALPPVSYRKRVEASRHWSLLTSLFRLTNVEIISLAAPLRRAQPSRKLKVGRKDPAFRLRVRGTTRIAPSLV